MAKARMLHNKISKSIQVENLQLKAQLLFTWMLSHADDDGRMLGDPRRIKAEVVPLKSWSTNTVKKLLIEIENQNLIRYWEQDGESYIEFPTWTDYQQIKTDRYKPSKLPTYDSNREKSHSVDPVRIQNVSTVEPQYNVIESNKKELNKSELNNIADISVKGGEGMVENPREGIVNPKTFKPQTQEEFSALEAWKSLEPTNPMAFTTTYMKAVRKGVSASLIYQWASEIKQDPTVENKGKVFNKKLQDYLNERG